METLALKIAVIQVFQWFFYFFYKAFLLYVFQYYFEKQFTQRDNMGI